MATKKSQSSQKSTAKGTSTSASKTSKKSAKSAKKAVKKEIKRNKGFQIALTVIVVAIVVAVVALYVFKPDAFYSILSMFTGKDNTPDDANGSGGQAATPGITEIVGDKLQITFVNVGQGDGIFIEFPDGQTMVMDMGTSGGVDNAYSNMKQAIEQSQTECIDYVFATHTDSDHISSMATLIDDYEIKNFYLPKVADDTTATWNKVITKARNEQYNLNGVMTAAVVNLNVGKWTIEGEGWSMKCYSFDESDYPTINKNSSALNKNSVSPLCVLTYGGRTIVLSGDSNEKNEQYFLDKGYFEGIDCDVYKLPHHGADNDTAQQVFNAIDPEYTVISVGTGNSYGHPTQAVLDLMASYVDIRPDNDYNGIEQVYRTDLDGNVVVQVGESGTLNLISSNDSDKNKTQATLTIISTSWRVDVCVSFAKKDEIQVEAA
ncbi:MAG: ComEC/Rec2 family competence protein [Christensenellales bacterium]